MNCICIHYNAQLLSWHHWNRPTGLKRHFSSRDHEHTTHTGSGSDEMEGVGHVVTVAKGSFESKELLLCFTFFFFKQSLQCISVKPRHDAGVRRGSAGGEGRRPHALQ